MLKIGGYYRWRNLSINNELIAKNNNGELISGHHPFVIFYDNENVYYLTLKTGREKTKDNKLNIRFADGLFYDNYDTVVNCSVINVMKREEFELSFEPDGYDNDTKFKNGMQAEPSKFKSVINKLHENITNGNISFEYYEAQKIPRDKKVKYGIDYSKKLSSNCINRLKNNIKIISQLNIQEIKTFMNTGELQQSGYVDAYDNANIEKAKDKVSKEIRTNEIDYDDMTNTLI